METNCIELGCDECCKRYWITLLPKEAKKISGLLKISEKKFMQKYCLLHLNLFPTEKKTGMAVSSALIPKTIAKKAEKKLGKLPGFFILLPGIVLKRSEKGECISLSNKMCEIYSVRPEQCSLFPFISMDKKDLKQQYPFCRALEKGMKGSLDKPHLKNVNAYFAEIEKNGFESLWAFVPESGIVCIENKFLCRISKKDFLKISGLL